MAESSRGSRYTGADDVTYSQASKAAYSNKRRSHEIGDGEPSSKISKPAPEFSKYDQSKPGAVVKPIKMNLNTTSKPKEPTVPKKKPTVASVFNNDSSSDEEEIPPEAKMRMRNIGRNTPTAAGPNSYGKGRLGFCDRQKMIQREIQEQIDKDEGGRSVKK